MRHAVLLTVTAIFFSACAGKAPPPAPASDEPMELVSERTLPEIDESELTEEKAREIIDQVEARWPLNPEHPLSSPSSMAEAEAILKLDQVRLFPAAMGFLATQDSVEAVALRGQIELAWAEAYAILIEISAELYGRFTQEADQLEAKGGDPAQVTELRSAADELRLGAKAFSLVLPEHLEAGHEQGHRLIEEHPDNYLGYRVAADYYRLAGEWEKFDAMIAALEQRNPESNGLRFLRGIAAMKQEKDPAVAERFYREALERDPEFVRAQAHLLLTQGSVENLYRELGALETLNPEHQLIMWAGNQIREVYARANSAGM